MKRSSRTLSKLATSSLALAAIISISSPLFAQQTIDVQNFRPALGPRAIYSVEGADTLDHMKPSAGVMLNYASQPLLLTLRRDGREKTLPVVDQQLGLNLMMGLGLFDFLQLDFVIPIYPVNDGDTSELYSDARAGEFGGLRSGDLALRLKGTILSSEAEDNDFGLAFALEGRLPTGDASTFVGDTTPVLTPKLIADLELGPVFLAANFGAALRSTEQVRNIELGSELVYGVGAEWRIMQGMVALGGELFGKTQLVGAAADEPLEFRGSPLEFLLGVKLHTPSGFSVTTGAGAGIIEGYGAPEFRAIIGITYVDKPQIEEEVAPADTDGDKITDDRDACPDKPEDLDGFQDEDGCPEEDNDGDQLPDDQDKCPDLAEDVDGFEDEDGCPDIDNDGDGIEDADDKCPDKAGVVEQGGCAPVAIMKMAPKRTFSKIILRAKNIELLEKVFFETSKATIKPESYALLDEIVALLNEYPQIKLVEVSGHTDSAGKAAANKKLSQERADAVVAYMVEKGVAAERLKSIGHGQTMPLVKPEKTDEDKAKNRRVEFNILEQDPILEKNLQTTGEPAAPDAATPEAEPTPETP